ncbi:hypothetical protein FGRMN_3324 [Fusarium graminum]|nr:hypothetical protein FGRMN_3324 [Fusarium graminum]
MGNLNSRERMGISMGAIGLGFCLVIWGWYHYGQKNTCHYNPKIARPILPRYNGATKNPLIDYLQREEIRMAKEEGRPVLPDDNGLPAVFKRGVKENAFPWPPPHRHPQHLPQLGPTWSKKMRKHGTAMWSPERDIAGIVAGVVVAIILSWGAWKYNWKWDWGTGGPELCFQCKYMAKESDICRDCYLRKKRYRARRKAEAAAKAQGKAPAPAPSQTTLPLYNVSNRSDPGLPRPPRTYRSDQSRRYMYLKMYKPNPGEIFYIVLGVIGTLAFIAFVIWMLKRRRVSAPRRTDIEIPYINTTI